jgi:uncharacterized membrane protein YccF (DUF307 family)
MVRRRETALISLLLNVLWLVFGGVWMAVAWLVAAAIMAVTIIGIPFAFAALRIAQYTLLPFGYANLPREGSGRPATIGSGPLGFLGNIAWFVLAGWWLAIGHAVTAFLLAITIIGIPFAWAHLKLAGLALWPFGRDIVPIGDVRRA